MKKVFIFDLGGVLIDWDPRYLYRQIIDEESEIDIFLSKVCNPEWNMQQDAGRSLAEATAERVALFPGEKNIDRSVLWPLGGNAGRRNS